MLIRRLENSAPGPDGVPYAAYKAIYDTSAAVFSECLGDGLSGDDLPDEMAESLLIFIPEGDSSAAEAFHPGEVRPLTLGNTDAKIIAMALNFGLS